MNDKTKTGFKIFLVRGGERTALCSVDIAYPLYKWSRPWRGNGPIHVFTEPFHALPLFKSFCISRDWVEMWEVDYVPWEKPFPRTMDGAVVGWRRNTKSSIVLYKEVPSGTAFAAAIRPMRMVWRVVNDEDE